MGESIHRNRLAKNGISVSVKAKMSEVLQVFPSTSFDLDWVQPSQDGGVILLRAIRRDAVGWIFMGQ
jgi:hypothetical protein